MEHLNPIKQITNSTKNFQQKLFWHYNNEVYPIGTATFISYSGHFFLLTCWHCIKDMIEQNCIKDIIFFARNTEDEEVSVKLHLDKMWFHYEKELDLAVFELDKYFFNKNIKSIEFIEEDLFNNIKKTPPTRGDLVFLSGSPYYTIDMEKRTVRGLTLKTTIDCLQYDYIKVIFDKSGIVVLDDDSKTEHDIETLSGLSGAPAYRVIYNIDKKSPNDPFCFIEYLGILQRGSSELGNAYILDVGKIVSFLDRFIAQA